MHPQTAIDHFGSIPALAKAVDVEVSAVYQWRKKGFIPEGSAYKLQVITSGKLQVVQSMYDNLPKRGQTLATHDTP